MFASRSARGVGRAGLLLFAAWGAAAPGRAQAPPPPAQVALLVDSSASLRAQDLDRMRGLAADLLAGLPAGSQAAVFSFDDQSRLLQPRTGNVDDIAAALARVQIAGRFTALNDALYDASRYLGEAPGERKAIVVMTDGYDENSALQLDDALKLAQQASIPVFAVGVGHVRERVLRRIAKLTGGEYAPAEQVAGGDLAARIRELPLAAASASTAGGAPPATGNFPGAGTSPAPGAARRGEGATAWGHGLLLGAIAAALLVAAGLSVLALRRQPPARCPRCGRVLPGPLAPCPACPGDDTGRDATESAHDGVAPPGPRERAAALSETVVARMDLTEEYLDKTVTLREEPALLLTAGAGTTFFLSRDAATSLGRSKANDIVLEDVSVSSQHCRVRPEAGRLVLLDLRSTNGTWVNGRRVSRHALEPGDVIKLGETSLQFKLATRRP